MTQFPTGHAAADQPEDDTSSPERMTRTYTTSPADIAQLFELMDLGSEEQRAYFQGLQKPPATPGRHHPVQVVRLSNNAGPSTSF